MNDYDYTNAGFSKLLSKNEPAPDQTEDIASQNTPQLSGTVIGSGISKSPNGRIVIDWDKEQIFITDGGSSKIYLGNIDGLDKYGLKVVGKNGGMTIDSYNQTIIINDGTNDRVLIGYGDF